MHTASPPQLVFAFSAPKSLAPRHGSLPHDSTRIVGCQHGGEVIDGEVGPGLGAGAAVDRHLCDGPAGEVEVDDQLLGVTGASFRRQAWTRPGEL
jgi:hypothetical protein